MARVPLVSYQPLEIKRRVIQCPSPLPNVFALVVVCCADGVALQDQLLDRRHALHTVQLGHLENPVVGEVEGAQLLACAVNRTKGVERGQLVV